MEIRLLIKNKITTSFLAANQYQVLCVALLLTSLCVWPGTRVQGQTAKADLLPPRFIPKSPTLTPFQRFDNQQLVSLPTGAAQLVVPLAEVSCGTLRLPVSLSYSYSGLQVYQPKDLVGLGWALQAGASISLQVNGLLDSRVTGANRYNADSVLVASQAYLKRAANSEVDTGPDLYSFSIPGGASGRFSLRDTTVTLLTRQPVHIRALLPQARTGGGFQLTTEDGVRYLFLVAERTHPSATNFTTGDYNSAWHLNQIIAADNTDTLSLHYSQKMRQPEPAHCAVTTGHYSIGYSGVNDASGVAACGKALTYTVYNVFARNTTLSPQYLESIVARGTQLSIQRDSSTQVVQYVRLISTIGNQREIRRITLFQSAFPGATPTDQRVRLDSLQESANGIQLPAYRFQYSDDGMQPLPTRGSSARDYWGYFNGARNGDASNPTVSALLDDPLLPLKANREPIYDYAVLGALKQVTYPTGGYTRWEYESGRVGPASGEASGPTSVRDTTILTLTGSYDQSNSHPVSVSNSKRITTSKTLGFVLAEAGTLVVDLSRSTQDDSNPNNDPPKNTYRDFNIWLRRASGDSLITSLPVDRNYETDELKRFRFPLPSGEYIAVVYCEYRESCELEFHIPYTVRVASNDGSTPGAGIRVRRTRTRALGAPALVKTYDYLVPDAAGAYGSGFTLSGGRGFKVQEFTDAYQYDERCESINTSSDVSQPGDEFNKYSFFYSCVTARDSASQGATISYYGNQQYQFNEVVLLKQQVFRQDTHATSQLQLAQQDAYTYAPDSILALPLLQSRLRLRVLGGIQSAGVRDLYVADSYQLQTAFMAPVLTQQVRYDEQGAVLSTVTRSTYEHQRLRQTATRTSTGWDIQRYKHLSDYASQPAVTALRVNSFNPVLETQIWHRALGSADSLLTGGRITLYDPTWRSPARLYQLRLNQPLPALNQEAQTNGRYTSLLSDTRYEPTARVRYARKSGDLIEQLPTYGLPTSYLTGYQRTLVIAQVQNASYNQVAFTSFEPDATGRWLYDSTGTHRQPGGRTGRWAYALNGTASVRRPHLPAGDYELTFWRQGTSSLALRLSAGATQPSAQPQLIASALGDWHQYRIRLHFPAGEGQVQLDAAAGGSFLLDELRLAPVGAQLTSYTHDPLVGITSQTDPTGRTLTYEYDGLGRLVRTRDEQGRILSQQQYHYAGK